MKTTILCLVCFALVGCSPWFSGGGSYHYKRFDPSTNATIEVAVKSTREIGEAKIHFGQDGNVTIEIEGIKPGPDNTALALGVIQQLVKAGVGIAAPAL